MSFDLKNVSTNGLGIMSFTWRTHPLPLQTAFDALNEAISINLPQKTFINAGEFYGPNYINLQYLQRFFEKHPSQREHCVISVKGAIDATNFTPLLSKAEILHSIDTCLTHLSSFEIFEPARINTSIAPLSEIVTALDEAVDTGRIKAYTLSEVDANTLRSVYTLSKHKPVGVEVEFSLFTRDILTDGLMHEAGKLDVPVIAYSPLSRGILAGGLRNRSDIPDGDFRSHVERFKEGHLEKNLKIVDELVSMAKEMDITVAQLALAWVHHHSGKVVGDCVKCPAIIPIPSSATPERVRENFKKVQLTLEEFEKINTFIQGQIVHGHR